MTAPEQLKGNRLFAALAVFVLRFPWLVLFLTLVVTLFMAYQIAIGFEVNTDSERLLGPDSETIAVLEKLRDDFGRDNLILVLVRGEVFSTSYLQQLKKLHQSLEAIDIEIETLGQRRRNGQKEPNDTNNQAPQSVPSNDDFADFGDDSGWGEEDKGKVIEEVLSLYNARQTIWREDGLRVETLLDKWPSEQELPRLKQRVLSDQVLVGRVVNREATHSVLIVRTGFMSEKDVGSVYTEVERVAKAHNRQGFHIVITGVPALIHLLNQTTLTDQVKAMSLAVLVVTIVALIIFRHPLGVVGPTMVVLLASSWTVGLMALLQTPITTVTSMIAAFVTCVGCGDSIHIQSVYRDARKRGLDNRTAIIHSLSVTGLPVFYTSITTVFGLLSLTFASLGGISEMGTFSAFGVTAAMVNSLVFLPAVLSFNRKSLLGLKREAGSSHGLDKFLNFCNNLSRPIRVDGKIVYKRRNYLLGGTVGLFVIVIIGLSLIRVHHNALDWFPKNHPAYTAFVEFEHSIGGAANIALLINAKADKDLKDKETVDRLARFDRYISDYQGRVDEKKIVYNTTSYLDVIRESWQALNNNDPSHHKIPETQRGISDTLTLFENASPSELKKLMTIDMKKALMVARVKWLDAMSYIPLAEYIRKGVKSILKDIVTVEITGSVFVATQIVSRLVMDMLKSFGAAILVISIVMITLLRDIKLGLISMIPNLLPVLSVMALMGYTSIPLDLSTVLLGSLAIGVVVDDTIHFLHQFKAHYDQYGDVEQAIQHSFEHTGRAMVITSVLLVFGFLCDLVAELLHVRIVGSLLAAIMTLALLIDLCLCPALLRTFYKAKI